VAYFDCRSWLIFVLSESQNLPPWPSGYEETIARLKQLKGGDPSSAQQSPAESEDESSSNVTIYIYFTLYVYFEFCCPQLIFDGNFRLFLWVFWSQD
jgi:hypothetical protein